MDLQEIKETLQTDTYSFLAKDPRLGDKIALLGLGGSHAYGVATAQSDLDVRGFALNSKKEILTNTDFEQIVNNETDTTIYSFQKLIHLLTGNNPNVIEILGLKPEHYLYISPIGKELLEHKDLFFSQQAINTFGGYITQQLYRLKQLSTHEMNTNELETHILKTLENMMISFPEKYSSYPEDAIQLYIGKSNQEDRDTEIFMDIQLTNYPLRDYCNLWNELQTTVKQYNQLGKRNKHALEHNKMGKHQYSLLRVYNTGIELLETGVIKTYRDDPKEHQLYLDCRNNRFVTKSNQIRPEFFEIINELERHFDYAKRNTVLPEKSNTKKIEEFVMNVNERIVRNEL